MSQITKPIALDETLQDVVTAIQGITQGGMIVSTGTVGSATQPVYIDGGVPTAVNYNINVVSQADSTIETLVTQIKTKAVTLSPGAYSFFGSWNSHSNGYQAAVVKGEESATFWKVSGTIYEYAQGRVWTFIDTYNSTTQAWSGAKIRQISGITTGTATLNSQYISSGSITYAKSGNVVNVWIEGITASTNIPAGTNIASNLPKTALSRNRLWLKFGSTDYLFNLFNTGILTLGGNTAIPSGAGCSGSFTYITSD